MREGLLWFDADPKRDLAEKVAQAADRYREKFGRRPNLCYVNPAMLVVPAHPGLPAGDGRVSQSTVECDGVRLAPAANVLAHHFWIGVEEGR
jgi:hypothetical protein